MMMFTYKDYNDDGDDDDDNNDDNDLYLKKVTTKGVTKSGPTQKCRPAKGIRELIYL
jgi:hypothetical protein